MGIYVPSGTVREPRLFVANQGGALTVGAGVSRLPIPPGLNFTIQGAYAMVNTAPTGAAAIFDILKDGVTIYTGGVGRPQIAAGGFASQTPVAPAVTALNGTNGDYLTWSVVQIGSTVAGSDLTLVVLLANA